MMGRLKQIISESGYSGLVKRLSARVLRERNMMLFLARDTCFGSYKKQDQPFVLNSLLKREEADLWRDTSRIPQEVIHHYLEHRFDLLGSGWVKIFYGMNCRGLEQYRFASAPSIQPDNQGHWLRKRINKSNLLSAQKIWQQVDPDYIPIDWQIDFKSGYRWSEKTWSKKIKFGHELGVDVKVPWELARMQHLPQLALACFSSTPNEKSKLRSRIKSEFQNQILDFIATNPPGYGVNWICPMDVAIRAANWLLAWNLLHVAEFNCSKSFEEFFAQSIYEHGLYIIENLEWMPDRANHYLANVSGLVFIAASLPSTEETDLWLAFAVQELIVEVERQFDEDGGNFEGSTSYHRLSAEMVYYATAVVLGLTEERLAKLKSYNHQHFKKRRGKPGLQPAPLTFYPTGQIQYSPFPRTYLQRMERMAEFIRDITKPDGSIPQIGDNDSGRFFKLDPVYQVMTVKDARERYTNLDNYDALSNHANYYMEDHLDCSHIVVDGYAMFGRNDFADWLGGQQVARHKVDAIMLRALAAHHQISPGLILNSATQYGTIATVEAFHEQLLYVQGLPEGRLQKTEFTVKEDGLLEGLKLLAYPDFGLFLFRSPRLYLAIRCWIGNKLVHSSHRHQDQLSVELSIDGKNLICDPGTYLYTSLPAERGKYRESDSHFSPFSSFNKSDTQTAHVFSTLQLEKAHVVYWGAEGFVATTTLIKETHQLLISLGNKSVVIYHGCDGPQKSRHKKQLAFSSGYGIRDRIGTDR
ncbi:heparinase II/III family protein [Legionella maioricensis]|uniref:Heparinase II/III family protein n=1 Tax=Legionella maioricensis TaxID=2896528 RepID=A0A9X2CZG1_9GAMM|nr:heparinase II/III family protein [Legionella maioricensis]MCL9683552.1 heparinase II/III family protein [Legionella maioricensis]MCL9686851.1 heparinase II/III family protein [Legionella maioricensis]